MRGTPRSLCACLLFAALASSAQAQDPYAEFRIPDYRLFSWAVTGEGALFGGFRGNPFEETRDRQTSASFRNSMNWSAASEARSTNLAIRTSMNIDQSRRQSTSPSPFISSRSFSTSEARFDNQQLGLFASRDQYWNGSPMFVGVEASNLLFFSQQIRDNYQRFETPPTDRSLFSNFGATRDYEVGTVVELRAGLGRVRNVTGVHAARLVEQRLRATGRLEHELTPGARRKLAEVFYLQGAFGSAHERSSKYFWREIERILNEDGALKDGVLDAYSVFRVLEPVMNRFSWGRQRGLAVAAVTSAQLRRGHRDTDFGDEQVVISGGVVTGTNRNAASRRERTKENLALSGLSANYGQPFGENLQLNASTLVRYGAGSARLWQVQTSADLVWLVADRWFAQGDVFHVLESPRIGGNRLNPNWNTVAQATLGYWVEDAWAIEASFTSRQEARHSSGSFATITEYDRFNRAQIAVTYLPKGRFDAPGLGISQHLTPGVH